MMHNPTEKTKCGPRSGGTYAARASERWGDALPEWIGVLAKAADAAHSLSELAKQLGYSVQILSATIGRKYGGRLDGIEAAVKRELMGMSGPIPVKTFGPRSGGTYAARASERWGDALPEWIGVLAKAADAAHSLSELAKQLGYSVQILSATIGRKYGGRLDGIEAAVRGALMKETVDCPVMGMAIGRDRCAQNQKLPFSTCNPMRTRLYHACNGTCPHGGCKC